MKRKEKIYEFGLMSLSFSALFFLGGIVIVLFKEAAPLFKHVKISQFLLGQSWYPTYDPPEFGILPLIMASVWVSLLALCVCVPLGLGSALYLNEVAGEKEKSFLKPMVEILAGIPSIVYGFFGMVILAPWLQNQFHLSVGLCLLTAGIILGVMATPTVCSIAEDALSYVPKAFREASYAVGANRWQTLIRVVIPAAGSGISTAIILGLSRALGETMTVLMVAGGAAVMPSSIFDPVRPMTAAIAAEMGEAPVGSLHHHSLFAIALALFIATFVFNIVAELIARRFRAKIGLSL